MPMKSFLPILCLAGLLFAPVSGASAFLADAHAGHKVECRACHAAGTEKPADDKSCIACHGDLDAMAEKSEGQFSVNPHAPHGTKPGCLRCHQGHKAQENYCNKCHDFDFRKK